MSAVIARLHDAAAPASPRAAPSLPESASADDCAERDSAFVRSTFRRVVRRACVLVTAVALLHAAMLYAAGESAWIATAIVAAACAPAYPLLAVERPFAVFLAGLAVLAVLLAAAVSYLTLRYGHDAGFHLLLIAVVPVIAVAGRVGVRTKWLLIVLQIAFVVLLDACGRNVGADAALNPAWAECLRALNLGVVVLALGGLTLHYFHIAAQQQAALERLAWTDPLTGLLNRRRIEDVAAQAVADGHRHGYPVALVVCDIDHFKIVNDRWGHDVGDAVLRHAAQLLRLDLRGADSVGRWGGEEFALVLPHTELAGAVALAERIRRRVRETPLAVDSRCIASSVTLGVALVGTDEPLDAAIKRADVALYCGKSLGRDRVVAA